VVSSESPASRGVEQALISDCYRDVVLLGQQPSQAISAAMAPPQLLSQPSSALDLVLCESACGEVGVQGLADHLALVRSAHAAVAIECVEQ